jgi:hypothetical protein
MVLLTMDLGSVWPWITGGNIFVGAYLDDNDNGEDSGTAYAIAF